jgi:anti-anti-sigma regulatory factor
MASIREAPKEHEPALIAVADCDEVARAIDCGATEVVVDLRTAEKVGTCVVNMLLDARSRLLGRGGHIALIVTPRVRRIFGLLGLDHRFVLAANRRQAFERLGLVDDHQPYPHHARAA